MPNSPPPEPPRVTDGQIAEWDALTNAATEGSWSAELNADPQWAVKGPRKHQYIALTSQRDDEPNARFIAASREAMPALLAEVKRLKAENNRLQGFTCHDVDCDFLSTCTCGLTLSEADSRAPRTTERL